VWVRTTRYGKGLYTRGGGVGGVVSGWRSGRARLLAHAAGGDEGCGVRDRDIESVLLDEERIRARVAELAARISADYRGLDLLLVGVLKGAVVLMADLSRALTVPHEVDFIAVSSYGSATETSGVVRLLKDLDREIAGRHVILVEDIVDTGLTLDYLLETLRPRRPASLEVCVLLCKTQELRVDVEVKYKGFDIPSVFVVGYGLDYAERYRNLRFVGTLRREVYERPDDR
jgi:hypoxanthine phosphoribosyltransferase